MSTKSDAVRETPAYFAVEYDDDSGRAFRFQVHDGRRVIDIPCDDLPGSESEEVAPIYRLLNDAGYEADTDAWEPYSADGVTTLQGGVTRIA